MAPLFSPVPSSSPACSTRPTRLYRPENGSRRRAHRSSSWSTWAAGPLFRQLSLTHHQRRSSIQTRDRQSHSQAFLSREGSMERKVAPRDWRRMRNHKKSIAFEENTGLSVGSATGTVRRAKSAWKRLVSGIFQLNDLGKVQENHQEAVIQEGSADNSTFLPRSWIEEQSLNVDSGRTQYWREFRRKLEADAMRNQSRRRMPPSIREIHPQIRREPEKKKHFRTVSRDDQLTSRGANPRTGMVSPSIMSEDDQDSPEKIRNRVPRHKWRLKGDQWISLDLDQTTPLPTPPAEETAQHSFHNMQGKPHDSSNDRLAQLMKSGVPLSELEDRFVVSMPSLQEPCATAMAAQRVVDFQKAIERVYREGGEMLDPNTLPTPRAVTPEGLSTPPKKLSKKRTLRLKRKPVGSPPSVSQSRKQRLGQKVDDPETATASRSINNERKLYAHGLVYPTLAPGAGETRRDSANRLGIQKSWRDGWRMPRHGSFLDDGETRMDESPIGILISLTANGYPAPPSRSVKTLALPTAVWVNVEGLQQRVIEQIKQGGNQSLPPQPNHFAGQDCQMPSSRVGAILDNAVNEESPTEMQGELVDTVKSSQLLDQLNKENLFIITTTMTTMSIPTTTTSPVPYQERLPSIPPQLDGRPREPLASCLGQRGLLRYDPNSHIPRGDVDTLAVAPGCASSLESDQNGPSRDTDTLPQFRRRRAVIADIHGCTRISGMLNDDSRMETQVCEPFCIYHECYKNSDASPRLSLNPTNVATADGSCVRRKGYAIWDTTTIRQRGVDDIGRGALDLESLQFVAGEFSSHPTIAESMLNGKCDNYHHDGCRQNGLGLLDALTLTFSFLHEVFRDHNTFYLHWVLQQLSTMSFHCLNTGLRICATCCQYVQTGTFPRIPRSRREVGELVQDLGRAGIYCAILVAGALVVGKVLGYLIMIGSCILWIVRLASRVCGWTGGSG
jgi:hypothetical protein